MLRVPPSTPPPAPRTPLNAPGTPAAAAAAHAPPPPQLLPPDDGAASDAIELTELTAGGRRKGPDARAVGVAARRSLGVDNDGLLGAHSHTCSAAVAARQRFEEDEVGRARMSYEFRYLHGLLCECMGFRPIYASHESVISKAHTTCHGQPGAYSMLHTYEVMTSVHS